jgi:non-specific serine/threonine protein kinase
MLSRRQTEIVNLIAAGRSNREISERLWLSERTVESHVAALFSKLNVGSRTELAMLVLRDGLIETTPKTNLSPAAERIVGREREMDEIASALLADRLVTVTGAGGVGKTRTAIAVAAAVSDRFRDGIWLAELAPVAEGHRVVVSIAQAIGAEQLPENRPLESLVSRLKRRRLLIVLDNCEHLVAPAAVVVDALLRGCPDVRILATSREALKVAGERIYRLPPLDVPTPEALRGLGAVEAGSYAAIALFVERAGQANRYFQLADGNAQVVAAICRRLDGIPLAIELAAARTSAFPLATLLGLLDRRFSILTSGQRTAFARQQTMRALFDWSYDLLLPAEQRLFDRLSVFAGAWTLESAEAVCAGDAIERGALFELLASLVDKSLVTANVEGAEPRYFLSESAREYARENLAQRGEREIVAGRHALGYLALAEQLESAWETTPERAWLARARPELDNWRAALTWALALRADVVAGQRLAGALRLLFGRVAPAEGRRWVRLSLELVDERTPLPVRAKLDFAEAGLASALAQHREAFAAAERALASYRALGDAVKAGLAQVVAGASLTYLGDSAAGDALLHETLVLARELGNRRLLASVLSRVAYGAALRGDVAEARAHYAETIEVWKALDAEGQAAITATNFAEFEFQHGDARAALRLARDALGAHRALGQSHNVVEDLLSMAAFLIALAHYDEAQACAREAFDLVCELQFDLMFAVALQRLAAVALFRSSGDVADVSAVPARAARVLGFVEGLLSSTELRRHYIEQHEYDRMLAALRAALGAGEVATLMAAGALMNHAQAIGEAERLEGAMLLQGLPKRSSANG